MAVNGFISEIFGNAQLIAGDKGARAMRMTHLCNFGNFKHNTKVMEEKSGVLIFDFNAESDCEFRAGSKGCKIKNLTLDWDSIIAVSYEKESRFGRHEHYGKYGQHCTIATARS